MTTKTPAKAKPPMRKTNPKAISEGTPGFNDWTILKKRSGVTIMETATTKRE